MRSIVLLCAVFVAAIACLPVPRAATFEDVTLAVGIDHVQHAGTVAQAAEAYHMTGGAAVADFDNDGWPDLLVTRLDAPCRLYRNTGGHFTPIEGPAIGIDLPQGGNGAAWADIDNDGDADLYVTTVGQTRNYLYLNEGNGRFREVAYERRADVENTDPAPGFRTYAFSAAFGDYDRDGWLDLFTTSWLDLGTGPGGHAGGVSNRLLRNRGSRAPGHFEDTTGVAQVEMNLIPNRLQLPDVTYAYTPRFADLDGDGWPDLAVAGDFGTSRLYWNRGDGGFVDGTLLAGVGTDENGMGSAIGDYDGDGRLDWFVSSIFDAAAVPPRANWGTTGNRLFRNAGNRSFVDATTDAGVRDGGWGWGATFFDYDNDADLDLALANGMLHPTSTVEDRFNRGRIRLWQNAGAGRFEEVGTDHGLLRSDPGKGLVVFDYDLDGRLDMFVVFSSSRAALYRNTSPPENAWIKLRLIGSISNRDAIGARVTLETDAADPAPAQLVREVDGGSNFLGHDDRTLHFGLGSQPARWQRLRIRWPSGIEQSLPVPAIRTALTVHEPVPYADWISHRLGGDSALPVSAANPEADPDRDGAPNAAEYAFGTDPLDATSSFEARTHVERLGADAFFNLEFPLHRSALSPVGLEVAPTPAGPWVGTAIEEPSGDDALRGRARHRVRVDGVARFFRFRLPAP